MRAVLLIGHGSLRPGSGAAMFRLAARAREAGVAPIVEAGFLNYSRPMFAEALARCVVRSAREIVVQPYFLVPGKFARTELPRLLQAGQLAHPTVELRLAEPFGDHPALAELVLKRAAEAQGIAAAPPAEQTALLLMAHGSPDPCANQPIRALAERIMAAGQYTAAVCFLELNEPSIPDAIDQLVARGVRRLIVVPYFLQLGGHVAEDLPQIVAAARARHPTATIILAQHLAYDRLLVRTIADRVAEAGHLFTV
jgi:sirohydrochlorin cobaltochelatase